MSIAPINDIAVLHERMEAAERQNEIWLEHHRVLAQQIAELAICVKALNKDNTEHRRNLVVLEERLPELMAAGIAAALGNPLTWKAARDAMHRGAREAAGGWLLGSLKFAIDKLLWVGIALAALYMLGGWPAVASILKLRVADS